MTKSHSPNWYSKRVKYICIHIYMCSIYICCAAVVLGFHRFPPFIFGLMENGARKCLAGIKNKCCILCGASRIYRITSKMARLGFLWPKIYKRPRTGLCVCVCVQTTTPTCYPDCNCQDMGIKADFKCEFYTHFEIQVEVSRRRLLMLPMLMILIS